jgi:hypothetical protein
VVRPNDSYLSRVVLLSTLVATTACGDDGDAGGQDTDPVASSPTSSPTPDASTGDPAGSSSNPDPSTSGPDPDTDTDAGTDTGPDDGTCVEGPVDEACICDGATVSDGHCCAGIHQQGDCSVYEADYYVAPDGNDEGPGSFEQPFATWGKAFETAAAGDLVYFRDGVYFSASDNVGGERGFQSGTADAPIRFFAYPGETPTLDCAERDTTGSGFNKGITMWHVEHIHMKGLHVRNVFQGHTDVRAEGVTLWDVGNITLENMVVHDVEGEANVVADYYDTVEYINCDAYNMVDADQSAVYPTPGSPGQNGAGFHQRLFSKTPGYEDARLIYRGCRAWNFSDNGFAGTSVGYVEYDSCWAFDGGLLSGEGAGFKYASVYGDDNTLDHARVVKNCIGAMNGAYGFSPNNRGDTPLNGHYFNNLAYHNGYKGTGHGLGEGFVILDYAGDTPMPNEMYSNNISYDNELGEVNENDNYTHEHNSWDLPVTVSDDDFVSLDWTQLAAPRKPDGSLPDITFGTLAPGSDLIDAGVDVGLPYAGDAPDLGWAEAE